MTTRLFFLTLFIAITVVVITDCGRKITEKDVIGKYCSKTANGNSVLYILEDHTYQHFFYSEGNERQITNEWSLWENHNGSCRLHFQQWSPKTTQIMICKKNALIFDPDEYKLNFFRCD